MNKEELLDKLSQAIINGDEEATGEITQEILSAGIDPIEAINEGGAKGLDILGQRFERHEVALPELILGGDAMKVCMDILKPHIKGEGKSTISQGKVVIGTIQGDIHDIGKNLVAAMLSIEMFDVHDLGNDVPIMRFIEKAEEVKAQVLALSTLITTSIYYQEHVIKYLNDMGLRNRYYVVVGGGPVTPEWATHIGADGTARNALDATQLLKRILTEGIPPPLPEPIVIGY